MFIMTVVKDTLDALNTMSHEPTDAEASVLETVTRQVQRGHSLSVKQYGILCEMVEKYLQDKALLQALVTEDERHG